MVSFVVGKSGIKITRALSLNRLNGLEDDARKQIDIVFEYILTNYGKLDKKAQEEAIKEINIFLASLSKPIPTSNAPDSSKASPLLTAKQGYTLEPEDYKDFESFCDSMIKIKKKLFKSLEHFLAANSKDFKKCELLSKAINYNTALLNAKFSEIFSNGKGTDEGQTTSLGSIAIKNFGDINLGICSDDKLRNIGCSTLAHTITGQYNDSLTVKLGVRMNLTDSDNPDIPPLTAFELNARVYPFRKAPFLGIEGGIYTTENQVKVLLGENYGRVYHLRAISDGRNLVGGGLFFYGARGKSNLFARIGYTRNDLLSSRFSISEDITSAPQNFLESAPNTSIYFYPGFYLRSQNLSLEASAGVIGDPLSFRASASAGIDFSLDTDIFNLTSGGRVFAQMKSNQASTGYMAAVSLRFAFLRLGAVYSQFPEPSSPWLLSRTLPNENGVRGFIDITHPGDKLTVTVGGSMGIKDLSKLPAANIIDVLGSVGDINSWNLYAKMEWEFK